MVLSCRPAIWYSATPRSRDSIQASRASSVFCACVRASSPRVAAAKLGRICSVPVAVVWIFPALLTRSCQE